MIPFERLNQQNHEISELCKVLGVLITDRSMCDTSIVCELFERFATKVKEHLELEDRSLYARLLTHPDKDVNAQAVRSLNGSKEIKRIFSKYTNTWCRSGLDIYNHADFVKETEGMFRLILDRIQAEVEELYPLVRSLDNEELAETA